MTAQAPKVTIDGMKAKIKDIAYFNLHDAMTCYGLAILGVEAFEPAKCVTIAVVSMENGFLVIGKSACACIENYDQELGEKYALEDAMNQLWPLEGYLLKTLIHGEF